MSTFKRDVKTMVLDEIGGDYFEKARRPFSRAQQVAERRRQRALDRESGELAQFEHDLGHDITKGIKQD